MISPSILYQIVVLKKLHLLILNGKGYEETIEIEHNYGWDSIGWRHISIELYATLRSVDEEQNRTVSIIRSLFSRAHRYARKSSCVIDKSRYDVPRKNRGVRTFKYLQIRNNNIMEFSILAVMRPCESSV
jgi:hypothetical protein